MVSGHLPVGETKAGEPWSFGKAHLRRDHYSALKINIILNLCVSDVIRHYREGRRAGYSVGYLQ